MKKQLHKIKIAAENFSRPAKPDKNSEELLTADRQVEKYKDVLEKISKKFSQNTGSISSNSNAGGVDQDLIAREKRCKKVHEYRLAQSMEESLKDLPDGLLRDVLSNCAKLEKNIANEIIDNENYVDNNVTKKLTFIMDNHITTIQKQKRIVTKLMQDNESAKHKHQAALRVNESAAKISQLKEEQEECETKLEKERDIWAAEMFELIVEEEQMAMSIIQYIKYQKLYFTNALRNIEDVMENMDLLIKGSNKRIFKEPLIDHLAVTNRKISYVIELGVCCLLEKGLYEEGLLRVGSAGTKLRRLRSAIDAHIVGSPFPIEYQDVHVIAGVLKSYLRDLPDPLLTYKLYNEFLMAAQQPTEEKRKKEILIAVNLLPPGHYSNLRYLTKFLSILSQKSHYNKMSSQNIAIVMSPNLLWPPDSFDIDYVQKVNSTAAVNTIVELLVSDWSFFFEGDIDFFQTMKRDELFPDNGGFSYDRDPPMENLMTKSMHVMGASSGNSGNAGGANNFSEGHSTNNYQTHSRSNSHDTSLILLGEQIKRSQSNSSISDNNSSPPQNNCSPKLPVRRKHNKQAAPTPPEVKLSANAFYSEQQNFKDNKNMVVVKAKLHKTISDCFGQQHHHQLNQPQLEQDESQSASLRHQQHHSTNKSDSSSQTITTNIKPPLAVKRYYDTSTDNLTASSSVSAKPDKPPRPVLVSAECQTLNRSTYKSKAADRITNKPIALPRQSLARSSENLTDIKHIDDDMYDYDGSSITLRDKTEAVSEKPDKPAIPERPISLMRPPSFKGNSNNASADYHQHSFTTDTTLKKTQSFRNSVTSNSMDKGLNNTNNGSLTTLERTHIYNVDKKQVAIIDVVDTQNSNNNYNKINSQSNQLQNDKTSNQEVCKIRTSMPNLLDDKINLGQTLQSDTINTSKNMTISLVENNIPTAITPTNNPQNTHHQQVPPSPRGFDPKIKRPQIPAPPPPTNRPKSDGGAGDSTNL